jgi:copper transport protein
VTARCDGTVVRAAAPEKAPAVARGLARRLAALAVLLLGLGVVGVAAALPASAHAELVSAAPGEGARLASPPDAVTLRFSEPVSIDTGYLRVLDRTGKRVDTGPPRHPEGDATTVTVPVQARLPDGGYLVSWRVLSADSHPVGGAYSFAVGNGAVLTPTGVPDSGAVNGVVGWAFTVVRWLGFAGLALLGGAVFLTACWREGRRVRRARGLVWTGWGLVAGSTVLGLLLEGPYGAGTGLSRLLNGALLDATLHTTYGRMLWARLMLLGALAVALAHLLKSLESSPWLEDATALAGLATLATFGGAGHAVAGVQAPLAVFSDTLHLSAMSVWLGGLAIIVTCLLRRVDALAVALPVFSPIAMGCVATLAVTGTYRSWREIGSWDALFGTTYGRIVLVKIGLLAVLLVLGNASRLWVRRLATAPIVEPSTAPAAEAVPPPARGAVLPSASQRVLVPAAGGRGGGEGRGAGPDDPDGSGDPQSANGPGGSAPAGAEPAGAEPPWAGRLWALRKSVLAELAVAAVVLGFTAVLVAEPPARASYARPVNTTVALAAGSQVQVTVTPAKAGPNEIHVYVLDQAGRTRGTESVAAFARLPGSQYDRLPVALARTGTGHYTGSAVSLPVAGRWELDLTVRLGRFEAYTAVVPVTVR